MFFLSGRKSFFFFLVFHKLEITERGRMTRNPRKIGAVRRAGHGGIENVVGRVYASKKNSLFILKVS